MCVHVSGRLIVELFCKRMFSKIHVYSFSAASYKPIVFAKKYCAVMHLSILCKPADWTKPLGSDWTTCLKGGVNF